MARPKKVVEESMVEMTTPAQPIPVRVVSEAPKNPNLGKFPNEDDKLDEKVYRFTYFQSPGGCLEFSRGITVLKKNGKLGTKMFKYALEDGNVYRIPVMIAKFLNGLTYDDRRQTRQRCLCAEVEE